MFFVFSLICCHKLLPFLFDLKNCTFEKKFQWIIIQKDLN